jgi:ATP-binding cassette subfamily B protein
MERQSKNLSIVASIVLQMIKLAWKAQPWAFVILILLTLLEAVLPVGLAWATKMLFDVVGQALQGDAIVDLGRDLLPIIVLQGFMFLLSRLMGPVSTYIEAELGRKVTLSVQKTVYQKVGSFSGIAYFENPKFYDTLRLATQGAQSGPVLAFHSSIQLLQGFVRLSAFAATLLVFSPFLALMIVLAALPRLFMEIKIGQQRFDVVTELSRDERRAFYYSLVLSSSEAAKEVRLFGLIDYFLDGLLNTYQKIHRLQRKQQLSELRLRFLQEIVAVLGYSFFFGVFAAIIIRTALGKLSLGDIPLYLGSLISMQDALMDVVTALGGLNEQALFFSHYKNLLALPQPLSIVSQPRLVPALTLGIELRNVSFRYTPQHPWVLRNVNMHIPAGKCVALVGVNGAGKTTLVKLLTRLYEPTEGQILWNGVDIGEFDPRDLRLRIGVVLQDYMRYALTAKENIGLGNVQCIEDMDLIELAARKAGIHEAIQNLPETYQTTLSRWLVEDDIGVDLSSGQWQRVALARVFMRDASMLILDEPTAALDAQAEYDFYDRFVELANGRTGLLISHRFSTVKMADFVAVIEDGQITEYGTHAELLSQERTYAHLYTVQAKRYV